MNDEAALHTYGDEPPVILWERARRFALRLVVASAPGTGPNPRCRRALAAAVGEPVGHGRRVHPVCARHV